MTTVSGADPVNTRYVTGNSRTFESKPGWEGLTGTHLPLRVPQV